MKSCSFVYQSTLIKVVLPFYVQVHRDIGKLSKDDIVNVTDIKYSPDGRLIYSVKNELYFAYHFELVL